MREPKKLDSLNNYFDDLVVGDTYETGSRRVEAADIDAFAQVSGDKHPFHTNDEVAKKSPVGERFAHGLLTLAFLTGLQWELMRNGHEETVEAGEGAIFAWYAMDNVRFTKPVCIGDTLRVVGEITGLRDKGDPNTGVVKMRDEILNQDDEPVMVLERSWVQFKRAYHENKQA